MDTSQSFRNGAEAITMSLVAGVLAPFFFNGLVQGEGIVSLLIVLGVFGTLIIYGEIYVSFPSGVAFAAGMLMTSFAGQNWWLVGLATAAWLVKLARYAKPDSEGHDGGRTGISLPPAVSEWFKGQAPERRQTSLSSCGRT